MDPIRSVETRKEWQDLVSDNEKRGLSQVEFCKQKNVSLVKFGYYRSIFLKKEKTDINKNNFKPVTIKKPEYSATEIRIILPNGFQCFLSSKTDPAQAKQLLGVLLSC